MLILKIFNDFDRFIGGKNSINIIGVKFKMMGFQLMQLLIIELCLFNIFPCFIEHFVIFGKVSFCPTSRLLIPKELETSF
jgi:hypothetical protein